jgi:hypothetical protein
MRPEITGFLRQDTAVRSSIADSVAWMRRIAEKL